MENRLEEILAGALAKLAQTRLPEATYRLQFHAGFTFRDATELVPYFHDLGITDCYVSPILKARSGSKHGYDITEHNQVNPEIGTAVDFENWVSALKGRGLGQILDMVPNHMAVLTNENPWWNDVLENGPASPFASFFDIAWTASTRAELQGRVLVPILGQRYGQVLEAQQLSLKYLAGAFSVHYYEHSFPVAPRTYGQILAHRLEVLGTLLGAEAPPLHEYQSILTAVKNLPGRDELDPAKVKEGLREKEIIKRRLATLTAECPAILQFLEENLASFNGQTGAAAVSTFSKNCWTTRPIAWPTGAWRRTRSITAAFLTSTTWPP